MNRPPPQPLKLLLNSAGIAIGEIPGNILISQVTDDSRSVVKGALFVAVKGNKADGHRYVMEAVKQGATAVLSEEEMDCPSSVLQIRVPSTRAKLGPLAAAFFGNPSGKLKLIGVTGTNGKTTVSWLIQRILEGAGIPCGLIGTISYRCGDGEQVSSNTTPGAVALQTMLWEMVSRGLPACSMEVSSHALDQDRTKGATWACGVFTNLTPEHLDYHQTLEQYLEAKLCLFKSLSAASTAVINRDDPSWQSVKSATAARVLTYSLNEEADFRALGIRSSLEGTDCFISSPEGRFPFSWGLLGRHNLENLLAALGALNSCSVSIPEALRQAASFQGVPGRLERIEAGQPFPVFVDYAHTDGALRQVLQQLRIVTQKKIILVFGCGGDRDKTKRPRMGKVAAEFSDQIIVTSDNPRSENPGTIAEEVAGGLRGVAASWRIILDRKTAIQAALESADEDSLVVIAGKGHETNQIIGDRVIPFDDRQVARELLAGRQGVRVGK